MPDEGLAAVFLGLNPPIHLSYPLASGLLIPAPTTGFRSGPSCGSANNVDNWNDAPELLAPGRLLDGGAKEGFVCGTTGACGFDGSYVVFDEGTWSNNVAGVMNVSYAGLPVMPIIGSAGCESPQIVPMPTRDAIEEFAYASYLLAAGTRTSLFGIVPYYFRNASAGLQGGLQIRLHPRYFYPVGAPTQVGRRPFSRCRRPLQPLVGPDASL